MDVAGEKSREGGSAKLRRKRRESSSDGDCGQRFQSREDLSLGQKGSFAMGLKALGCRIFLV